MHELSIASSLLDVVLDAALRGGGGRIASIRLVIGRLAGVEEDALSFGFEALSRGTAAEGARVEVVARPFRIRCRACGDEAADDPFAPCPACGAAGFDVLEGRELRVESIDVDGDGRGPSEDGA